MSENVEVNEEVIVAVMNTIERFFSKQEWKNISPFNEILLGSVGVLFFTLLFVQLNRITFIAARIISFLHFWKYGDPIVFSKKKILLGQRFCVGSTFSSVSPALCP